MRKDWKQVVQDILNARVRPAFIIAFGSHVKGTAREDSELQTWFL